MKMQQNHDNKTNANEKGNERDNGTTNEWLTV